MSPAPIVPRTLPRIVLWGLLLAGAYEFLLRFSGVEAEYAESNFQSNLIRLGNFYFHAVPADLILGSSLSGRLVPDLFEGAGGSVGNLAMDGCGVPFGLAIVAASKEKPQRLFLETNSLFLRVADNERVLQEALLSFNFLLSRHVYLMRAASRPSALVYSSLKKHRDNHEAGSYGHPPRQSKEAILSPLPADLALLRQMKKEGMEIFFVVVPEGRGEAVPGAGLRELALELGARWIEPRKILSAGGMELRYTDGLHLDRESARQVAGAIQRLVRATEGPEI